MDNLRFIVCLKQVPDPEAPVSGYRIDVDASRVVPVGIPPVISPFDENALEAALRVREITGGKIVALSVGWNLSKAVLRKALAAGADELVMVDDPALSGEHLDGYGTATVMAGAIRRISNYDMVLTGRQASDTNAGVVGLYVARLLEIPAVTFGQKIILGENVRIERMMPDGYEAIEAALPLLVMVGAEIGELRSAGLRELKEAKSKPVTKWSVSDVNVTVPPRKLALRELKAPARERACCFIEGASCEDAGDRLALKLREDGVL